jgi:hypothetical protein
MKKFIVVLLVSLLSAFMVACQRDQGVQAGSEGEYQPRPAPANDPANQEVKGELVRVDAGGKRVAVRVENGMVQTFKVGESTQITGVESDPKSKATGGRQLVGKEGSEVTVLWIDDGGSKIANSIEVTQLNNPKTSRRSHR